MYNQVMIENQSAIEAKKLVIEKGKQTILSNLSFKVKAGTVTGLIGPSGAGKTTLMRSIVGVQKITSGELTLLGKPAGTASLRQKIGYVTQSPAVYSDLTVEQNLRYFASLVQAESSEIEKTLIDVRLVRQRKQLVESLSGGQQARVSLAVALLGSPEILILDEPTVGLDPLLRRDLWRLFAELAKSGRTLLVSSHVMDEAEQCDELLLLRDGRLLWSDSKQALLKHTGKKSVGDAFIAAIEGKKG